MADLLYLPSNFAELNVFGPKKATSKDDAEKVHDLRQQRFFPPTIPNFQPLESEETHEELLNDTT